MPTNTDRVLDFIQAFPGRDDDEIARVLAISPRQQVNQICRRLARQGRIRRAVAGAGKLANFPVAGPALPPARPARQTTLEADNEGELQADGASKPPLTDLRLVEGGFAKTAQWTLSPAGVLATDEDLPSGPGVYAFVREGLAQYVGVAAMGLRRRLRFYARPGATQRTSQRLNQALLQELKVGREILIYTACPPDLTWNGLPVSGPAGLEIGLIQGFHLPWNIRGVR